MLARVARRLPICAVIALLAFRAASQAAADPGVPNEPVGGTVIAAGQPADLPVSAQLGSKTSEFTVSYQNVPAPAQAAVEHAVAIWERQVATPVEILVRVSWESLPADVVVRQRIRYVVWDPVSFPTLLPGIFYPSALAQAIRRSRTSPEPDIEITLNSSATDWYLGIDGEPEANQFDLVTAVLSGLASGSGLSSGFRLTAGVATVAPTIFDRFVATPGATPVYEHSAASMAEELVSGMLTFTGANARVAAGGAAPELYAPPQWSAGLSVTHLDDSYWPPDPDSLIGPFLYRGWALHDPGPITLAMLKDIGWTIPGAGVPWRLRVTSSPPLAIPGGSPVPVVRVEIQDAVGVRVATGNGLIGLWLFFWKTSPTIDLSCRGGLTRTLSNGQAAFDGCQLTGTGSGYFLVSSEALVPGVTRTFLFGNLQRRFAPGVAHGP